MSGFRVGFAVFDEAIQRFKGTHTKIVHDFAYSAFGFDAKNQVYLLLKMQRK